MDSNYGRQVYVVNTPVNYFPRKKRFDQKFFGCCVNPKECTYMTCCFPCALSEIGEYTGTRCCLNNCCCWLIISHCCCPCGLVKVRQDLKMKLDIETSVCDPCISLVCFPCASCQTYHEVRLAKYLDSDLNSSLIDQPIVVQRMER